MASLPLYASLETTPQTIPGRNPRISEDCRYQIIAQELSNAIRSGSFAAEQKMPSLRKLAEQYHIGLATAVQVYNALLDNDLLESRPRSGYFVRKWNGESSTEPAISRPSDRPVIPVNMQIGLHLHKMLSKPVQLSLGVIADPVPDLLPSRVIARHLGSVTRRYPDLGATYCHPMGHDDLRVQIARHMTRAGCVVSPEEVLVTTSCQDSISIALRTIVEPGDTIAIESPTFLGISHLLSILHLKVLEIPTHPRTGVDLNALQQALARHPVKACIFMPRCHMPLGSSMPEENIRRLVSLLAKAGIPLIEDDAAGELFFEQPRPKAAKSYDRDGNVIYCGSFSKILGPGQRIGWIVPGRFRDAAAYTKGVYHGLSSPVWQQLAIARFLAAGGFERSADRAVKTYKKRVRLMQLGVSIFSGGHTRHATARRILALGRVAR